MTVYHRVDGLVTRELTVHRDQLQAQCSVMSMRELYLSTLVTYVVDSDLNTNRSILQVKCSHQLAALIIRTG